MAGSFRVLEAKEPDVTVENVYFPQDRSIQVHASRVRPCPPNFPAGFYWYGGKRRGPGRPPRWIDQLLQSDTVSDKGGEEDCEVDRRNDCERAVEMDTERSDLSDEDSNQANELEGNVLRDSCLELDEAELSTSAESTTSVGDNSDKTDKLSSSKFEFVPMARDNSSQEQQGNGPNSMKPRRSTRAVLPHRYGSDYVCYRLGTSIS